VAQVVSKKVWQNPKMFWITNVYFQLFLWLNLVAILGVSVIESATFLVETRDLPLPSHRSQAGNYSKVH
jgi:hypothetical protein